MDKIFALYHFKESRELIIRNYTTKGMFRELEDLLLIEEGIYRFNDCIYLSKDRNKLRELAKQIKDVWVKEAELRLKELKEMKIVVKY
jgi:hypothetical protein